MSDEITEAKTFVRFAHQNQATVRVMRDPWKSTFSEALNES